MVQPLHSIFVRAVFLLGLCAGTAMAQPETTTQPTPDVTTTDEPVSPVSPVSPETATDLLRRVREVYATTSFAQRGAITLQDPQGRSLTSPLAFSVRRTPGQPRPMLALRLGHALLFSLDSTSLRGVHLANSGLFLDRAVEPGESVLAVLESALPPLAAPPIWWAIAPEEVPLDRAFWMLPGLRWDARVLTAPVGTLVIMGQSESGAAELTIDATTFRVVRLLALIGSRDAPTRFTLRLDQPPEPARLAFPPVDGRVRVATLADLKPRLPEIGVGSRLPSLGLMGQDLSAWSLDSALLRPAPPSLVGKMDPARGVVILFAAGPELADATRLSGPARSARAAAEAAEALAQEYQRRTVLGDFGLPLVATISVAVVEVGELDPEVVKRAGASWNPAAGHAPLWTTGGRQLMSRIIAGASAIAVVIDHEQRVLGTISLDAGLEPEAVAQELRRLLESRR